MFQMRAPPLLFIEEGEACFGALSAPKRPRLQPGTNQGLPRGRPGSAEPKAVRPIHGSAEAKEPRGALCFFVVADWWALMPVLYACQVSRRFRGISGPLNPCDVHVALRDSSGLPLLD